MIIILFKRTETGTLLVLAMLPQTTGCTVTTHTCSTLEKKLCPQDTELLIGFP